MGGLFSSLFGEENGGGRQGNSAANKITDHDRALLDLKHQHDELKKYMKRLEAVIDKETKLAHELVRQGKKAQALRCLRKRKFQESLVAKADGVYANITQMIDTIEFTQIQKSVFEQLSKGTSYLKTLQKEMSLERVESLMEDTQEALEYQKEVDQALSRSLTPEEDAAAELEYDELEKEWSKENVKAAAAPAKLPAAKPIQERKTDIPLASPPASASAAELDLDKELEALEEDLPRVSTEPIKATPAKQQAREAVFG